MPSTFLSLPLELRQDILLQSHTPVPPPEKPGARFGQMRLQGRRSCSDPSYIKSAQERYAQSLNTWHESLNTWHESLNTLHESRFRLMAKWIEMLVEVHESLGADLVYVEMKWREALEVQAAEEMKPWKEMNQAFSAVVSKQKDLGI
ncbi:hypothetical protein E6O75_ATG03742 [Venturia nashicola]|uniref:Uncharacterized protein n=1 Tax=Venturia nashicola TaxID=86259 RepID=A0A4Z1PEI1_9PEZI|nr:hypothetical protein E6O75_ATG03742 [Venturia nashicola]